MNPYTLIPYFTAYLIRYFYNLKTRDDRKKADFRFVISIEKYTIIKNKNNFFRKLLNSSITKDYIASMKQNKKIAKKNPAKEKKR